MGKSKQVTKNPTKIDFEGLVPADEMKASDAEETGQWINLLGEASDYLKRFRWCKTLIKSYLGIGIGDVLGVFLFHIVPSEPQVDEWIWVVVGDLPPGYITTEGAPNPACALRRYVTAMSCWVEAARKGRSVEGLIPVNAAPTLENANELGSRLEFLTDQVLVYYKDALKSCPLR